MFKKLWKNIKNTFKKIKEVFTDIWNGASVINRYASLFVEIFDTIENYLNHPAVDIINKYLLGRIGSEAVKELRNFVDEAGDEVDAIDKFNSCLNKEGDDKVKCLIDVMKNLDESDRKGMYKKIASEAVKNKAKKKGIIITSLDANDIIEGNLKTNRRVKKKLDL